MQEQEHRLGQGKGEWLWQGQGQGWEQGLGQAPALLGQHQALRGQVPHQLLGPAEVSAGTIPPPLELWMESGQL